MSHSQITNSLNIDHNNVSAIISDEGVFFINQLSGSAGYEVPKGSGKSTIYTMSPIVGALDVNGQLHLSGNFFGGSTFHSGPIADQSVYGTASYTNAYSSSIWEVTSQEVQDHIANYGNLGYTVPTSISEWPGNGDVSLGIASTLAPYVDVNNDGSYTPQYGDYPDIRGDQAVYVIMNDASFNPDGNELKMELHLMFYQISSANYLDNTTFMNVQTFNRSTTSYYNYKQSFFVDYDLGNYSDDYIGCDTTNNVAYVYNADELDESSGGNNGYGIDPPCQGLTSLSHKMESFGYFTSSSSFPFSDPSNDVEMWNTQNALFANGTPWVQGGTGMPGFPGSTAIPTNYMYSGNPNDSTSWTEGLSDGVVVPNPPGDRRIVMTIAEDEFLAGSSICSDYAFIYDKSSDRLGNVQEVINIASALKNWHDTDDGSFLCNGVPFVSIQEQEEIKFTLYPNPSTGAFFIEMPSTVGQVLVEVRDLTGRMILSQEFANTSSMELNLDAKNGAYFVKVITSQQESTQRIIKF
jgi:hypothetical protein